MYLPGGKVGLGENTGSVCDLSLIQGLEGVPLSPPGELWL